MKIILGIGLLLVAIAIIFVGPHITIWALNTLFGLSIAHGFAEWFATLWLGAIFASAYRAKSK